MSYKFKTHGTCASFIDVEMDGDKIKEVKFTGGCNGNLKAISSLVKGMTLEEVSEKLQGITCGSKDTSCADQLVHAIEEASKSKNSSSL